MTDQDQDVRNGSLAIQSARDTVIHSGVSPTQMAEILGALAAQFPAQIAVAHQIVNERLNDFERHFMDRFSADKQSDPEAFSDPDFQYIVRSSQHAYARSGDTGVRDTLIDLIARRSLASNRTRLSLTLNEAIEKSARLTNNEFAELSLCYLLRYTQNGGINSLEAFKNYFSSYISPLLPDICETNASYQYIEAQACGTISVLSSDVLSIFREQYSGIFSNGFDRQTLENNLPDGQKNVLDGLLIQCLNNPNNLQFNALNKDVFLKATENIGLDQGQRDNVWNMFIATVWNGDELVSNIEKTVPEIRILKRLWNDTELKKLTLNTAGIAIGHSNLVRLCSLEADLSIWIK